MDSTIVKNIAIENNKISAQIIVNGEENNVWYEFQQDINRKNIRPENTFLIISLPVAMRVSKKLVIEGEVTNK